MPRPGDTYKPTRHAPPLPLAIVLCHGEEDRTVVGRFADELASRGWEIDYRPGTGADLVCLPEPDPRLVRDATAGRTPVIVPIPVRELAEWGEAFGPRSRLFRARPESLWRWWGPERATEELIRATPEDPSGAIVVGYNWTMVEGPHGVGLAATPKKGDAGARTTEDTGTFSGRSLHDLAVLTRSFNPYERAIGCAAMNAALARTDIDAPQGDGLETEGGQRLEGHTVVVGRFPKLAEKLPDAVVLEIDPGPDDLPASAAADVVPGCARLIITATAWVNGTLPMLMRLAGEAEITLVGPGTPLSPAMHSYGIERLAGFVVDDRDGLRRAVSEGAGVRQFRRFGRQVLIAG